jgi:hypothetical protein
MKRKLFKPVALFAAVAVMLAATVALTFSRATLFASGLGTLKCYDVTGGIETACSFVDRPALIAKTGIPAMRD